jgi:5-deoxy-glucuronate isomerase
MNNLIKVEQQNGFNQLTENPCRILGFSLLALAAGEAYSAQTENREVLAVILEGRVTIQAGEVTFENIGERTSVFEGKPYSVYLPMGCEYTISAQTAAKVALPSAPSDLETDPYLIAPDQVATGVWGRDNFTRNYHQILTKAAQPELPARRLIVGETFTPSGNWSTYPAHKHEGDHDSGEAYHEEMYYFKVEPQDGFGITRYYHTEEDAINYTVKDSTILMIPDGYHTYVGAPGFQSYYLWFLAGEHRDQGVVEDPAQKGAVANV